MHYLICIINDKLFLLRTLHIPFNASYVVYIVYNIISYDLIRSQLRMLGQVVQSLINLIQG